MGKVKNREFWESASMNNATFMQYYRRLVEIAVSQFKWINVPDTVDIRYLELVLFSQGGAVFFKDEELGFLALRCVVNGGFNVYRIPKGRRAYADNGYNMPLNEKNSVIIYNNFLRTSSMLDTEMYAKRLYNIDRSIDVNVNAQKTPILIQCDEDQRLTMKNAYMKYEGNEPVIFGDKNVNPNGIKVFTTGAPYVAGQLYDLRCNIWNEALTFRGINNVANEKRERMNEREINANLGAVMAYRNSFIKARKHGCEQINKMFGLEMDCTYDDSVEEISERLREEVISE